MGCVMVCLFSDLCAAESGRFDGHPIAPRFSKRKGLVVSNGGLYTKTLEQTVATPLCSTRHDHALETLPFHCRLPFLALRPRGRKGPRHNELRATARNAKLVCAGRIRSARRKMEIRPKSPQVLIYQALRHIGNLRQKSMFLREVWRCA